MTVQHLVASLQILLTPEQKYNLEFVSERITEPKAKTSIKHGIGYHHAGTKRHNNIKLKLHILLLIILQFFRICEVNINAPLN